jgi:hypothetical protein
MEAAQAAPAPGGGPAAPTGGIADLAAAQARVPGVAQTQVAPSTVEPPLSFDDADKLAEQLMGKYKIEPGKRKEFTDFSKEYVDTLKNAGYDFDLVKNQVRELAKEKEALKGEKKEAQNLRLLEAGLGILGGESPYAFVNIGKGATPALQGLAKDLKEIKKTSRQLDKETMQLNLLQNQMAEGKVKYSQDRLDKQEDRFQRIVEKDMDNRLSLAKTLSSNAVTKYATDKGADTSLKTAEMQQQTSRINLQAAQTERATTREATQAERDAVREANIRKAAIEQAAEDVKLLPVEQQEAEKRKRAKQYYNMLKAKEFSADSDPVAAAQAEQARRRGIK